MGFGELYEALSKNPLAAIAAAEGVAIVALWLALQRSYAKHLTSLKAQHRDMGRMLALAERYGPKRRVTDAPEDDDVTPDLTAGGIGRRRTEGGA